MSSNDVIILPVPNRLRPVIDVGSVGIYVWLHDDSVRRVSPKNGHYIQSCIAPDGSQVTYSGCEQGRVGIWITALSDLNPRRMTSPDYGACQPAFSQDGKHIVFSSDQNSTGQRYGYANEGFVRAFPVTEPNEQAHIYITDRSFSDVKQITDGPYCDRRPAISPDDKTVAFSSNRSGTWELWTVVADGSGEPEPLLPGVNGSRPWYSVDGSCVYFQKLDEGGHQINVLNLQSGSFRPLEQSRPAGFTRGAYSTLDGRFVLAHSNRFGISSMFRIKIDGSQPEQLKPPGFDESAHVTEAVTGDRAFDSRDSVAI